MGVMTLLDRFESKFKKTSDGTCWIWIGSIWRNSSGYGAFYTGQNNVQAHRVSYELYKGPIPEGLLVLHTCDNRICVNPDHLYVGTNTDNMIDRGIRNPDSWCSNFKTVCKWGHPLSGANLGVSSVTGVRWCKECCKLRQREYRDIKREKSK